MTERRLLAAQAGIYVETGVAEKTVGDWRRKRLLSVKISGKWCSKTCNYKDY